MATNIFDQSAGLDHAPFTAHYIPVDFYPLAPDNQAPSSVNQPGFDWILRVPTEWDETRYLAGEVGEFLVIARRKNADWFLGAMTNASRR